MIDHTNDASDQPDGTAGALHLDPYYQPWLEQLADLPLAAYQSPDPQVRARIMAYLSAGQGGVHADVTTRDHSIDGPHGPFRVRVYTPPSGAGPWPALVWMHGGGFAGGSLDMTEADGVSREICARTPAVVVSVDYHLVTQTVFWPVPHDDCLAALRWVVAQSAELGIDPARVSVGGASAGGNLAAGVALRARDEGAPSIRSVALIYPVLALDSPPHAPQLWEALKRLPPLMGGAGEDPAIYKMLWAPFLGPTIATPSPYAVPTLADVRGLPPTLVVLSEYDGLRTGAEAFVAQLRSAGVSVSAHLEPGVLHGHLNLLGLLPGAERTLDVMVSLLASG